MHVAAAEQHGPVLQLLSAHGGDAGSPNAEGKTAQQLAPPALRPFVAGPRAY
jgi:hypothetical protein